MAPVGGRTACLKHGTQTKTFGVVAWLGPPGRGSAIRGPSWEHLALLALGDAPTRMGGTRVVEVVVVEVNIAAAVQVDTVIITRIAAVDKVYRV